MKRILALIVALSMAAGLFPAALADWGSGWGSYYPSNNQTVTASTSLYSASSEQLNNIYIASSRLASVDVSYGERFSFNDVVGPRTTEYGFKSAVNGRGAKVRGGGVGQVATTLYLALRQIDGVQFTELDTWDERFALDYTYSGYDAVIVDYPNNKDMCFMNYAGDMHIEMWVGYSELYCSISFGGTGTQSASMIGYASIPLSGTSTLKNNIRLAVDRIDGSSLYYYDEFSFNSTVGPRTAAYGYGSAINGRGVRVMGGGVAQVASVIYMAVKDLNCIRITDKSTYGSRYNQSYVQNSADAIVTDYNAGTDFCFRYTGYNHLTICVYVNTNNTRLICEVYEQ
ncbi:MAG: VanW family protein [Clostridia bacterium]|nr:VanW family protein [Clostridia bacterium]